MHYVQQGKGLDHTLVPTISLNLSMEQALEDWSDRVFEFRYIMLTFRKPGLTQSDLAGFR